MLGANCPEIFHFQNRIPYSVACLWSSGSLNMPPETVWGIYHRQEPMRGLSRTLYVGANLTAFFCEN